MYPRLASNSVILGSEITVYSTIPSINLILKHNDLFTFLNGHDFSCIYLLEIESHHVIFMFTLDFLGNLGLP